MVMHATNLCTNLREGPSWPVLSVTPNCIKFKCSFLNLRNQAEIAFSQIHTERLVVHFRSARHKYQWLKLMKGGRGGDEYSLQLRCSFIEFKIVHLVVIIGKINHEKLSTCWEKKMQAEVVSHPENKSIKYRFCSSSMEKNLRIVPQLFSLQNS